MVSSESSDVGRDLVEHFTNYLSHIEKKKRPSACVRQCKIYNKSLLITFKCKVDHKINFNTKQLYKVLIALYEPLHFNFVL